MTEKLYSKQFRDKFGNYDLVSKCEGYVSLKASCPKVLKLMLSHKIFSAFYIVFHYLKETAHRTRTYLMDDLHYLKDTACRTRTYIFPRCR